MQLDGVLFFPVTAFTAFTPAGPIDLSVFAEHVEQGVDAGAGAVFVACGTGEFHALAPDEHALLVRRAVEVTAGRVPVIAGTGGALPLAVQFAHGARTAGADGLLLLPPYLVAAVGAGLVEYTRAVAAATDLPLIVYNRGDTRFDVSAARAVAALPTVAGFKDGSGDVELLRELVPAVREVAAAAGKDFQFFNGMPTAEVSVPAFREIGIDAYSSAVFCFAPEISLAFYRAVHDNDRAGVERLLTNFYRPLVELRDEVPGYAVSLVKAAVRATGLPVGGVRAPLVDPTDAHLARLDEIVRSGRALVAGAR